MWETWRSCCRREESWRWWYRGRAGSSVCSARGRNFTSRGSVSSRWATILFSLISRRNAVRPTRTGEKSGGRFFDRRTPPVFWKILAQLWRKNLQSAAVCGMIFQHSAQLWMFCRCRRGAVGLTDEEAGG